MPNDYKIRRTTSRTPAGQWLNELEPRGFTWQEGYGAFSVSVSQRQKVTDYVLGQAERHKRVSFAEEFSQLLRIHGIGEARAQSSLRDWRVILRPMTQHGSKNRAPCWATLQRPSGTLELAQDGSAAFAEPNPGLIGSA